MDRPESLHNRCSFTVVKLTTDYSTREYLTQADRPEIIMYKELWVCLSEVFN